MLTMKHDMKSLGKEIDALAKASQQAAVSAINRMAFGLSQYEAAVAAADLDRPTPFTLKGFRYSRASVAVKRAIVYIADIQNAYLDKQITGGVRTPTKKRIAVPTRNARLNAYGNLPKGRINQMLNSKRYYSTGRGIFRASDDRIVVYWARRAVYRKRFTFYESGQLWLTANAPAIIAEAMQRGLRRGA